MADPAVVTGAFTVGGTLGGVGLGFVGQWWMERRKEVKQQRTAVSSILLEMALLSGTLHTLVLDREIRRVDLGMPAWARYGPELVNILPIPLVKAMHVYVDGFESVRRTYGLLKRPVHIAYAPYLLATVLSWAASMDRLSQLVSEYRKTRKLAIANEASEEEQFNIIVAEVMKHAITELEHAGLPVEESLSLGDDVDLSTPPPGWTPDQPHANTEEETQS